MWIHNVNIMQCDNGFVAYVRAEYQGNPGENPNRYTPKESRRVCLDWAGVEEFVSMEIAELNPKDMEEEHVIP
jgi:hypothetical protein